MLHKFSSAGSVVAIVLFGFACSSSKDGAKSDGGTGGNNVGTGGESSTGGSGGAHDGTGGSAGHAGGGSTSDGGSGNHDGGSTGGSGTSDSGSGGSNATDAGSTGGSSTGDSGAVADNALTNPGFEDGTMTPWTSNSSNFIVDGDSPRTGSYDGKLYSGFGDPTWNETMVQEGLFLAAGTYSFHIWVKKSGAGALTTLRLEAESGGSTKTLDALSNVTATYQEFSVTGVTVASPSGPNLGACTVRVVAAGDDLVSVYLDDASLTKAP